MKKIIFLLLLYFFINYPASYVFSQGKEWERLRYGTLPAAKEAASEAGPSAVEYFIAVNDVLEIFFLQNQQFTREVTVDIEGQISHPLLGRIKASGLTLNQLEEKIKERLGEYARIILPGDIIDIFVWQNPDLSKDVSVGPEGEISYPLVGRMEVAGFTTAELEEKIKDKLSQYIKFPHVSVTLKKFFDRAAVTLKEPAGNKIIILGEVNYPGIYTYRGSIDLIEAIALAGYFNDDARQDSVMIVRSSWAGKPKVKRINMKYAIRKGALKKDITLQPNDVVYVPESFVSNVQRFLTRIDSKVTDALNILSLRKEIRRLQQHPR